MKKSILFLVLVNIISFNTKAQTTELWGLTHEGGVYNAGVIFKTDANGNNQEVVYELYGNVGFTPVGSLLQASNGKLYGMKAGEGVNNIGILFEYDPATDTYTKKFDFAEFTGANPLGSLIQASNGKLYGTTYKGGGADGGVLFEYDIDTNTYTKKFDFDGANGKNPTGSLIQASNGKLYGMTVLGGANDAGVIFEYDIDTDTYAKKFDFDGTNGGKPIGSLIQASNGKLYGMTVKSGAHNFGVLFDYDPATNTYTKKFDFNFINGIYPRGSLIQASNGKLYGTTYRGGTNDDGVIFEYDIDTDTYTKKFDFDRTNYGYFPSGSLIEASNGKLYGMTEAGGDEWLGVLFEYDLATNTCTKKFNFNQTNGANPLGSLIQASNGKLYGATYKGGSAASGVLFEYDIDTDTYTKKIDFVGVNGHHPTGSLIQDSNGKLYGMTYVGGATGVGILFEYNAATGTCTKKFDFGGNNGNQPYGSLIQATNGKLYGMTYLGGDNDDGVIFEYDIDTDTYTKKFDFNQTNGVNPEGSLMQASNGKLYGMTEGGGANDYGVIFEYDPATNTYIKKFDFNQTNGAYPRGSLMQASNGKLYGMTPLGGANDNGVLFEYDPATDTYTKKLNFDGNNGDHPDGSLIQATNGKLYGMTITGGANNKGVLFEYEPATDIYTIKYDFDLTNGADPTGSLMQATNGKLYGTTFMGGAAGVGVLFEYDIDTDTYTKKFDFDGTNGTYPVASLIEVNSSLSIESQANINITISPNPTTNLIKISMTEKPVKVSVVNMAGVLIYETDQTGKEMSIDMSNYAKAVYLVKIQTDKGVATYKVIKQ